MRRSLNALLLKFSGKSHSPKMTLKCGNGNLRKELRLIGRMAAGPSGRSIQIGIVTSTSVSTDQEKGQPSPKREAYRYCDGIHPKRRLGGASHIGLIADST